MLANAYAYSLRCGVRLISEGDYKTKVLAECGEPSRNGPTTMAAIDSWIIFDLKMDGYARLKVAITAIRTISHLDNLNYYKYH
jgi:hypothetical protein